MSSHVIFEAFEVSAEAEKVLQCQSALQWDFPTSSAAIPHETFIAESFEQALAEFLEKSSHESVKQFASVVLKAGSFTHEPRDTPDPALITAMLNSLLEAMGQQFETRAIRKRVRDEVRREKGIPWRRSPFWLLLRVGILRHFEQSNSPPISNAIYKMLICLVHSRLLSQAASSLSPHLSHLILRKLGRRIAKLEKDVLQTKPTGDRSSDALISLLVMLRPVFQNAMDGAKGRLVSAWNSFKSTIQRRITPFRSRNAFPENFQLSLANSSNYLRQTQIQPTTRICVSSPHEISASSASILPEIHRLGRRRK